MGTALFGILLTVAGAAQAPAPATVSGPIGDFDNQMGSRLSRFIDAPKGAAISKNNQRRVKEILRLRKRTRRS
jgi:hypothetical protein